MSSNEEYSPAQLIELSESYRRGRSNLDELAHAIGVQMLSATTPEDIQNLKETFRRMKPEIDQMLDKKGLVVLELLRGLSDALPDEDRQGL